MSIPPDSIQVGQCYLMLDGSTLRANDRASVA